MSKHSLKIRGLGLLIPLAAARGAQDPVQHLLFNHSGSETLAGLGSAVLRVGDLDNDGRSEYAVGAPGAFSNSRGRVEIHSGATGKTLMILEGAPGADGLGDRFGASLALFPDLDGDGQAELVVGAPLDDDGGSQSGTVSLFSLVTGNLLVRVPGAAPEMRLGDRLLVPGDVNYDGLPDLIAAGSYSSHVRAISGAWLKSQALGQPPVGSVLLWSVTGEAGSDFGRELALVGDLNQDQVQDLAVGVPFGGNPKTPTGQVCLLSGLNGICMATLTGSQAAERFGEGLAALSDLDGDGRPELAIGRPGAGGTLGRIDVWRGSALATLALGGSAGGGAVLWSTAGLQPGEGLGTRLASGADLDADGHFDLAAVGLLFGVQGGTSRVRLLSGISGTSLGNYFGSNSAGRFGLALDLSGDINGDAKPDLLVGAPMDGADAAGRISVLSGSSLRLSASAHLIAVDQGGESVLSLDGGPGAAGIFYFVLGSASGTAPGTPTALGIVPLNVDWYTYYTLSGAPELIAFAGLLDSAGRATARVQLPAGSNPALTGLSLNYAWVGMDLGAPGFPLTAYSNAVPLGFVQDACATTNPLLDCNGNGIKDACDLASGTSYDCNGNAVPDECDVASGFSQDLDKDGLPDECRTIVYVATTSQGLGDGSSWANAASNLGTLTLTAGPYTQIWIKAGRYTPGTGNAVFPLNDRVGIYGGFAGNETSIHQRSIAANPTLLDADFLGNDGPNFLNYTDNAWTVVFCGGQVSRQSVLDGCNLRGGNSEGLAGCAEWAVYFAGCEGGGLYSLGSPTVRSCRFIENYGGHHGGAAFTTGDTVFSDCTFERNFALQGGAVYADIGARPEFQRCRFIGNSALTGGAVYSRGASSDGPHLTNCLLVGNRAIERGGALYALDVVATLINCTVVENDADLQGGGLMGSSVATLVAHNCVVWNNSDPSGLGLASNLSAGIQNVTFSTITGWTGGTPAMANNDLNPQFVDALGPDGLPGTGDEDYTPSVFSPLVDAGNVQVLPADVFDVDFDGNTVEKLPYDLPGQARIVDVPSAPNTGLTEPGYSYIDRGAFERQP
jgi:predicted outer membrane repeat protein